MADDGAPGLSIKFDIETGAGIISLDGLENASDRVMAQMVGHAAKIERATGGMVRLGDSVLQFRALGNASTRAAREMERDAARAERSGEGYLKSLNRQIGAFGKTREELRAIKAEELALANERGKNTVLAGELRAAAVEMARLERGALDAVNASLRERARLEEAIGRNTGLGRVKATDAGAGFSALAAKAAEDEARAKDLAAKSNQRLADEHARLAAMVQGSHAAQMANADAAERMRMSTDPLYAATARLNAEIAESTRLYHAGATAPAEYARQQQVLQQRLQQTTAVHNAAATAAKGNGFALTQLSFQINDLATMAAMGAPPMQILATQGGQIFQVFQMAEGGAAGLSKQIGQLVLRFSPLIAAAGGAAYIIEQYHDRLSDGTANDAFIQSLRLTDEELKKVGNTGVSMGDMLLGTWDVVATGIWDIIGPAVSDASDGFEQWFWESDQRGRESANNLIGHFVGSFNAIKAVWGQLPGALADVFTQAVNKGIDGINALVRGSVAGVNGFISRLNSATGLGIASIAIADIPKIENAYDGMFKRVADTARAEMAAANRDYLGNIGAAVTSAATERRDARILGKLGERKGEKDKEDTKTRDRLSADEKAYQAAAAAARDYAAAQNDMAAKAALNERELRLYADAAAIAKAPTEELAQAIRDAAAAREQALGLAVGAQFDANVLQPLRDEAALHGKVGAERERLALDLEKQGFLLKQVSVDGKQALAMWEQYRALKLAAIGRKEADADEELRIRRIGEELGFAAEQWDIHAAKIDDAARGMADAFGPVGEAIGGMAAIYSGFHATRLRQDAEHHQRLVAAAGDQLKLDREQARFALLRSNAQVGLYGDMAAAAKGFFGENTAGWRALHTAEKAFRAFEFAMSVRAMAQDVKETASGIANSGARAAADAAAAVAKAISSLPFPLNLAAGAATAAALASIGIAVGGALFGGGSKQQPTNEGKGTVLGDSNAQSQSIKRALDALKEVDLLMLNTSREMAASLRSIDRQIGGVASQVLRAGDIDASGGIKEGFKANIIGSVLGAIPLVGGLLKSLFGSTTTVTGSGLYAGPQTLGSILGGGFDASYYSDIQKKSKFLGITTSTKNSTQFTGADAALEGQFTLILREFSKAMAAAADPLGLATSEIERRLNGFVVNLGKIELKGLTGEQVQDKLAAVFGAAADRMASTAFPGMERFQRAGEGLFETVVRVSSTVEQVAASLGMLGSATTALGIDAKVALADQFESLGALSSATQTYFERFYTAQEQAAARAGQFEGVFASLGLTMPTTLAGFRALVDAQNLTTAAGRETYATLLQLAPAFADLQAAMNGARSAADILAERADLERKLLEVQGDTAAMRALDLAKLDPGNRALQEQIWALQDAQEAARAADDLRKAWSDVGKSIEDEVRRIRGLTGSEGGGSFASAMGQFNATTAAARAGDMDAAKMLPGLSQALLKLAADNATSRQELDRVQAQTASSLEQTMKLIAGVAGTPVPQTAGSLIAAIGATQPQGSSGSNDNSVAGLREELVSLREEVANFRKESAAGHAATAANTGGIKKHLDNVTPDGDAISVRAA